MLGLSKKARVGGGEQILIDAEHLRELERAAFEFAERAVNFTGIALMEVGLAGILRQRAAPVVLEIVQPDSCSRAGQRGHSGDGTCSDRILCRGHGRASRNLPKSIAESMACFPRRSKARVTDFSI